MSLGKREGSPEPAHGVAAPAAKRVKDEQPEFGADKAAGGAQAAASLPKAETQSHHPIKQLTPPAHGNDGDVAAVPQSPIDVDHIICHLNVPEGAEVARVHSNSRTADKQVQAYAKLAGRNWTFYVQQLEIIIGRAAAESNDHVDIDLGPSKIVSRKHAVIQYNLQKRRWEVSVIGRNGLRVDGYLMKAGATVPLRSGHVLDVGNAQMMFVLPDAEPLVAPAFVEKARELRDQTVSVPQHSAPLPGPDQRSEQLGEQAGSSYPRGVAIVSRPQVAASQGFEQDLGSDECKDIKPPFSYATMISQAILSTDDHMMSLADIYAWISRNYAFYRHSKPGWQNSIRHNLSLNKAFEKVARKENEPGKGSKWHIVPDYKDELVRKATTGKQFKNRAISPRRSPVRDVQPVRHAMPSQSTSSLDSHGAQVPPPMPSLSMPQGQPPFGHPGFGGMPMLPPGQGPPQPAAGPKPHPQHRQQGQAEGSHSPPTPHMQQQHPQQAGFAMPMPFQDVNGNSFPLHAFPYMQPFGMPYMPQQPGQAPMIPMMPPVAPHHPGDPQAQQRQGQFPAGEHREYDRAQSMSQPPQPMQPQVQAAVQAQAPPQQPQPTLNRTPSVQSSESSDGAQSGKQYHSNKPSQDAGHAQAQRRPSEVGPSHQSQSPPQQLATGAPSQQGASNHFATESPDAAKPDQYPGIKPDAAAPALGGTETPARAPRSLETDTTQTPMLDPNVRLAPPNGSNAPESSPALWKYMNLESTPNNNVPTNGLPSRTPGDDESRRDSIHGGDEKHAVEGTNGAVASPPGSSPPDTAKRGRTSAHEMPVLKQWEDNRA